MTVAAVILAASEASALTLLEGLPRVRRLADLAWSGGALPIIVVAGDPDEKIARALAGASVTLATPAPEEAGPVGQIVRGIDLAIGEIDDTDAALIWPARMVWVGPETITSLIEAHGLHPDEMLRPAYQDKAGWPALLPVGFLEALRALPPHRMPDELLADLEAGGVPVRTIDMGDPGTTFDARTARAELPPYVGPTVPASGHGHEWGAAAADTPEDAPLEGPRAPLSRGER
ncbi:MAG TPA: NTP transferase domain-containing protein [Candidatus Limnocylindrales bacterium]